MVTTTQSVRVSLDGGVTWLAAGALAPGSALDPSIEVLGTRRFVTLADNVRVSQQDGAVQVASADRDAVELLRGLPNRYHLIAAHASHDGVDRVLLEGGTMLVRGSVQERSDVPPRRLAVRRTRPQRRGHAAPGRRR
jgi:hypothetical protein